MDFRFNHLESLHWLWLVLVAALVLVLSLRTRRVAMARFASTLLWPHVVPHLSFMRPIVRAALLLGVMVLLVGGMLDPRWGVRYEEVQRRGIDILFVVDVSRSMLAEDVKPNRLQRAKDDIMDVVTELGGDRVGLISFAGVAAVKCPLTIDYGAFRLSLNELQTESAARGGSLLGDALRLAGDSFTDEAKDSKIVIVLSDGEDQGSYPVEAAQKLLEEKGAKTFTVGLGDSKEGARIPIEQNGKRIYLTYEGQEVWSKMNGDLLHDIAMAGGGAYVPAGTSHAELGQVYNQKIAPVSNREGEAEGSRIQIQDPKYQWFAGAALVLLLIESWMSDRKRVVNRMNESFEVTA